MHGGYDPGMAEIPDNTPMQPDPPAPIEPSYVTNRRLIGNRQIWNSDRLEWESRLTRPGWDTEIMAGTPVELGESVRMPDGNDWLVAVAMSADDRCLVEVPVKPEFLIPIEPADAAVDPDAIELV